MMDASTDGISAASLPTISFDDLYAHIGLLCDELGANRLANIAEPAATHTDSPGDVLEDDDVKVGTTVAFIENASDTEHRLGVLLAIDRSEDTAIVRTRPRGAERARNVRVRRTDLRHATTTD